MALRQIGDSWEISEVCEGYAAIKWGGRIDSVVFHACLSTVDGGVHPLSRRAYDFARFASRLGRGVNLRGSSWDSGIDVVAARANFFCVAPCDPIRAQR